MKKFLLLFFVAFSLSATEYPYRDINSAVLKHKDIEQFIILSTPRTGSTLAYMVFQYLFENKMGIWKDFDKVVVKSHDFIAIEKYCKEHPNVHLIVTTRHPIDSFVSLLKLQKELNNINVLSLLEGHVANHNMMHQFCQNFSHDRLTIVEYENFHDNLDNLFALIEKRFVLDIPQTEKEKMNQFFSKDSVLKFTKKYNSFDQYDPITGVHGNHISTSDQSLDDLVSPQMSQVINERLNPIAKAIGYK